MNQQTTGPDRFRLPAEQVRFVVSEATIRSVKPTQGDFAVIGQDRALQALEMATEIRAKGYNAFVTGPAGTGKRTAVVQALKERIRRSGLGVDLRDIVITHNFANGDQPAVLYFSPGRARLFRRELRRFVRSIEATAADITENESYRRVRDEMMVETEDTEAQMFADFEGKLSREGFKIVQIADAEGEAGKTDIAPVVDDEVTDFDDLQKRVATGELAEEHYRRQRQKYFRYMDELQLMFGRLRSNRATMREYLAGMQLDGMRPSVETGISQLRAQFDDPRIHRFLQQLGDDMIENVENFFFEQPSKETGNHPNDRDGSPEAAVGEPRYEVNIIVDHSETSTPPVVFERNPDFAKLFGSIEAVPDQNGEPRATHMSVRAGSLVKASGGFLVLRAEDVLADAEVWNALKRCLQDGTTEIRTPPGPFPNPGWSVKPEEIAVDVKVIIMGSEHLYDVLYNADDEFQKLFKVAAEFDSSMLRDESSTSQYVQFLTMIAREERLLPVDQSAIAACIEYGVRIAGNRNRISTRFSHIADILREADFAARRSVETADRDGKPPAAGKPKTAGIRRPHVEQALARRKHLANLPEEQIDEQIVRGELLIQVSGTAVGKVNGLAVLDRGYYAFGRPTVISATVAPGTAGVINIDRESGLSGEIHDKGTHIIAGYVNATFARRFPLSLSASICFEQSYVEVEGDSASAPEVYALLSAIAEIPLRQDIAVTGSVNQLGEIQPVGGVIEKVEGFYAVCRRVGFSGSQGVIVPRRNVANLILSADVVEAVETGAFHIYTMDNIDDGLEILTGKPAADVKNAVAQRLLEMATIIARYRCGGRHNED